VRATFVVTEKQIQRLNHITSLDGLRGVAVILVLTRHFEVLAPQGLTGITLVDHFFRGGYLGVDIFFVLSGFLITSLLLNEHAVHSKIYLLRFYGRRFLRLLPALSLLLVLYSIVTVLNGQAFSSISSGIWASFFYYLNWQYVFSFPRSYGDLGYLWSLSIEEQFYIVWPATLIILLRITKRAIIHISFMTIFIAFVMWHRHVMWTTPSEIPYKQFTIFIRTDARIDSLLVGCITALIYRYHLITIRLSQMLAMLGVIVLFLYLEFSQPYTGYMFSGGFTVVAVSVGCLILGLTTSTFYLTRLLSGRFIVLIGKTSYGIYLWHYPIFAFVNRHMTTVDEIYKVVTALLFTALFTTASWMLIETPALRLKNRKFSITR
jgi:peptidoglycan/LPS O-acetylase OafA/YrhL